MENTDKEKKSTLKNETSKKEISKKEIPEKEDSKKEKNKKDTLNNEISKKDSIIKKEATSKDNDLASTLNNDEIMEWDTIVQTTLPEKPRMKKWKKRLIIFGTSFAILASMYLTFVFSDIPFIEKWRTIYIETAMTTNSHQWLATWFFPKSVIDEVMARREANLDKQKKAKSTCEDEDKEFGQEDSETKNFYELYWELNTMEFKKLLETKPSLLKDGYDGILIEDMEGTMNLKTTKGDTILVVDTANGLIITEVKGEGYKGKLAIVKNPDQVDLVKSKSIGSFGQEAGSFGEDYDALLVVNASGFVDVDGVGTGGEVKGSMIIDGVEYGEHNDDYGWKFIGLQNDNHMYVCDYSSNDVSKYRWGVEFLPALIIDGRSVVDGTFGMGLQPRTALGQSKDGAILMLIVDGRQVGHSIGCTMEDLRDILMRYNCYQAMNLDGGSSSIMWYKGNYVTKSSSVTGIGRYMPDALIVKRAEKKVSKPNNFNSNQTSNSNTNSSSDEIIINASPKQ